LPALVITAAVPAADPSASARVTFDPEGTVSVTVNVKVSAAAAVVDTPVLAETTVEDAVPTATEPEVAANETASTASAVAFAGTTDKSPNPSEATATADTFFNEIVFTIFLSSSQIKDDLLPGW
jgi:hypothetical protein